jgi:hypothetical protein
MQAVAAGCSGYAGSIPLLFKKEFKQFVLIESKTGS